MRATPFYIIGNWKSNKTPTEAAVWCKDFETLWKKSAVDVSKIKIILCAPFIHLSTLRSLIEIAQLPITLGSQTVSTYSSGAYTGEISAVMLADLVKFALVGHSERRKYFQEEDGALKDKVSQAKAAGIEPIYCVQDANMAVPEGVQLVGYEPVWAIGTGNPDTAENANEVAKALKQKTGRDLTVIYGGSVTADNVGSYATMEHIDGVLPGGASLTATAFYNLITHAVTT